MDYALQAIELAQIMDQSLDENNVELVSRCIMIADSFMPCTYSETIQSTTSELASTFHSRFSASWVYSKVVLLGISFLEREHRYGILQLLYNSISRLDFFKPLSCFFSCYNHCSLL